MARTNLHLADSTLMHAEVRAADRVGGTISTDCARAIAAEWNDGPESALHRFASSVESDPVGMLQEIEDVLARLECAAIHGHGRGLIAARREQRAQRALLALRTYIWESLPALMGAHA